MPLRTLSPALNPDTKEALTTALDAMATCHGEIATSSEKLVEKMGQVARTLGWPDAVVNGIATQMRSVSKMHTTMVGNMIEACETQLASQNPLAQFPAEMIGKMQSWPGLQAPGQWPGADAFNGMGANPVEFWVKLGEQWQKNWAQMMVHWTKR
jgi:hypothetical protein